MTPEIPDQDGQQGREPSVVSIPEELDRQRLDVALTRLFPDRSRAYFQRHIKAGRITLNTTRCRPSDTVRTADVVHVNWPEDVTFELNAEDADLDVIYEDEDVLVLNKPPGLVVHPAKGNWTGTLVNQLLSHNEEAFTELVDQNLRPGIVHRLDKDTSGVMVVAKNEHARAALSGAFAARQTEKTYLAIVLGEFGSRTGTVDEPIGRHPKDRKRMAVVADGKHSITHYRVLGTADGLSLVEVRIETGRTHQIRVHMAHLRHPVLGDPVYGGRRKQARIPAPRQMLHAWKLAFPHPRTGQTRQYMGDLPDDFQGVLRDAGLPAIRSSRHDPTSDAYTGDNTP